MIEVRNKIKAYTGETRLPSNGPDVIFVNSCANRRCVVIEIGTTTVAVIASDLIEAIKNATNTNTVAL